MPQKAIAAWTPEDYERAAQDYLRALPREHFMEATPHAAQREITIESFAVLKVRRPDVQLCNELLVQYPINAHLGQVCPDNMVIESEEPLAAMGSFNLPFESGRVLWVLEYVSPSNKRKDYEDNFQKYQNDLKVPYYLIFDPETHDLRLYHHDGVAYAPVTPNAAGRLAVPELEVEVALLDGWARFWHKGELLPLPADLSRQLDDLKGRLKEARRQARQEKKRAEEEKKRADAEKKRADKAEKKANEQQSALKQAEDEVQRLRALLDQLPGGGPAAERPAGGA
ncbi:MAG TPA: Uma2 family endonuclease [Gemmataceae bacterium]|nr:Uma2 family endonuclease [Gemmataceae bacterium]